MNGGEVHGLAVHVDGGENEAIVPEAAEAAHELGLERSLRQQQGIAIGGHHAAADAVGIDFQDAVHLGKDRSCLEDFDDVGFRGDDEIGDARAVFEIAVLYVEGEQPEMLAARLSRSDERRRGVLLQHEDGVNQQDDPCGSQEERIPVTLEGECDQGEQDREQAYMGLQTFEKGQQPGIGDVTRG